MIKIKEYLKASEIARQFSAVLISLNQSNAFLPGLQYPTPARSVNHHPLL
jgi:hypothetical protein